jgi:acetate kinase
VPPALALLRAAQTRFSSVPQVACLDTAFHADLPDVARTLPIPRALRDLGIQRYGFHGLSCESIVRQLGSGLPPRVVIAHLGNGASVTAVAQGRSIDNSMGLTPSGGVIMGTRSGDLDPGLLLYLLREQGLDAVQLEDLIDHHCGLLGISGISSDMRRLHDASATSADAQLAIDMFCDSVRKQVAAMATALGGIDLLVFTGGIGEHDARVRAWICEGLSWLGIAQDSDAASCRKVRVLPAREEQQIAIHAWRLARAVPVVR